MIPETEREAIMRLSMCARRQCNICKYGPRKPTVKIPQHFEERITKNVNILADYIQSAEESLEW